MSRQKSTELGNMDDAARWPVSDVPIRPHPVLTQFYRGEQDRQPALISAFDESARHYDRINRSASFGSDAWYRKSALARTGLAKGMKVLDVGCGTGMTARFAKAVVGESGYVVGVDPSRAMLDRALAANRVDAGVIGVAERLPAADGAFDFLIMAFALRHVSDLVQAFQEMERVLRPGGELLILEFTKPQNRLVYYLLKFHLKFVVPTGGRSARWLYKYCWESLERCVQPETILLAMTRAGLHNVGRLSKFGIFSEYRATKHGPSNR